MYQAFFGLNQLPFKISPDLNFFYKQASRADIAQALFFSIERGDGIIKLVGEVGVGKTTILRLLIEQLPNNYQKIYASSPNLSPIDFLRHICRELGVADHELDTKLDLVKKLNEYLIEAYAHNARVVMLIDEAQSMTLDTLEEIRLLSNLETGQDKLLQIVLCGQPELDINLDDVRVRPLKDRIANALIVPPLSGEEVYQYLNYRMRIAGQLDTEVFSKNIALRILKLTNGLPRSINLMADKLLMAAYSVGDSVIKVKHFALVGQATTWPKWLRSGILGVLLALGLGWAYVQLDAPLNRLGYSTMAENTGLNQPVTNLANGASVSAQNGTESVYSLSGLSPIMKKYLFAENLKARARLQSLKPTQQVWVYLVGGYSDYLATLSSLKPNLSDDEVDHLFTLIKFDEYEQQGQFVLWADQAFEQAVVEQGLGQASSFKIISVSQFADILPH